MINNKRLEAHFNNNFISNRNFLSSIWLPQQKKPCRPSTKNFVTFAWRKFLSNFNIWNWLKKDWIYLFFKDSLFLYHKKIKKERHSIFQQLCSTRPRYPNQWWFSFHFRHDHFTKVFCDIRVLYLRWLSFFLWFNQLTILILLYYNFNWFFTLNFYFTVVLSVNAPRVKLKKKVKRKAVYYGPVLFFPPCSFKKN